MTPDLGTTLCGIALRNPVLAASGTFAYGVEFEKLVDLNALGGFVVKGLSREPIEGNPPPRVYESEGGMINSIGLQNIGVRAFVRDKLPALARLRTAVFANVFGYQVEDYVEVVRVLNDHEGLAGYELNVSCPNTCARRHLLFERPRAVERGGGGGQARGHAAGDRQAFAQRERHRTAGARSGGERRGRPFPGEHASSAWRSMRARGARGSAPASADFPVRPSSRSRCAWCTRRRRR